MATTAVLMERSAWTRTLAAPLRAFLGAEASSAVLLVAMTAAALVWANVPGDSYESLCGTTLAVDVGGHSIDLTLRGWVNSGLMSFFFFVNFFRLELLSSRLYFCGCWRRCWTA